MFKKEVKGATTFYCLPERKNIRKIHRFDEFAGAKEIEKYLTEQKAYEPSQFSDNWFLFYSRADELDQENLTVLPPGSYKHGKENYPIPERLEVYPTRREETYINLPELDILKQDLKLFIESKDIYKELGFAYRRGYLLHGRPGNGKTALIRSLLHEPLLQDAQVIWLSEIPSDAFIEELNTTDNLKVVVFEEIVNQNEMVDFSLSQLLAFMDGENSLKNCITIATTNYPQHLGENLANRPSRFDCVLEFKDPSDDAVYTVLEKLLKRDVRGEFKNRSFSFAQIKEIVLLHQMHKISLEDAALKLEKQTKRFERGFEESKSFGFGVGDD